jgi:hypothetical protein
MSTRLAVAVTCLTATLALHAQEEFQLFWRSLPRPLRR